MFSPYCPQEKPHKTGFSLGRLQMGDLSPLMTSAGGQSVNGGTHEGEHRPYGGGPYFDRLKIDIN